MIDALDAVSVWCGRTIAVLGVLLALVYGGAVILEALIKRAAMAGLCLQWMRGEFDRDPRGFWARMFWGSGR